MPRSSRRFPVQTRGPRRLTAWDSGPDEAGTIVTATGSLLWTTGVVLTTESKATVVRSRGLVTINLLGQQTADGDGFTGAVGLGIVSLDAFTAGAVPDPIGDIAWPGWLWYSHFHVMQGDVNIGGEGAVSRIQRIEIDSKAMRKMGSEEILFGAFEFVEQGTATVEVTGQTRILVKLS